MSNPSADDLRAFLATAELAELGPGPRAGGRAEAELRKGLDAVVHRTKLPEETRQLVCALVLLWHDHLDTAHTIAQGIENPDGSLVHAIMHRREPDYWNSKYWWRRVGEHPCFPELANRVAAFLDSKGERDLLAKLVPSGQWDPFAFVDACQAAANLPASAERVRLLRGIQRIETEVALEHFLRAEAR